MTRRAVIVLAGVWLAACQKPDTQPPSLPVSSATTSQAIPPIAAQKQSLPVQNPPASQPTVTVNAKNAPLSINWQAVDSGVKPVDKASFAYPFALDSKPVQAYAEVYHVDAATARYNLTVGMAANEPLDKLLDQLGTAYVSHELTAGKDSRLLIHTTARVIPSQHQYVFAEPYARGLTLTIAIINDGKKDVTASAMPASTTP